MRSKSKNAQKLDVVDYQKKSAPNTLPTKVKEIVETWKGKGWGFRFERKRVETTKLVDQETDDEGK